MIKVLFLVVAVLTVSACSTLEGRLASEVARICNMTESERLVLRTNVDALTAPHRVRVECSNGPE